MSRRPIAAAALVAAGLAVTPEIASAHALGQTFPLPVPLGLYLGAAALTVAASFVVSIFLVGMPRPLPEYRTWPVPVRAAAIGAWVLRLLGLVWWYGAIAVGFVVGGVTPLPAVLFWIFIWVGVPISAILLGNPWPSLSPFRTTHDLLERLVRLVGVKRLDLGLANPAGIARWPATMLLLAFIWLELIFPGRTDAVTLAIILTSYTAMTLVGMTLLGRVAWLREVELFEVLSGWFGRVGPLGRRATRRELCRDCGETCDPTHCVDCPECIAAADGGDIRPEYRPWITGLSEPMRPGWSDAAFILLALAGVTYDGLKETQLGADILNFLFSPLAAALIAGMIWFGVSQDITDGSDVLFITFPVTVLAGVLMVSNIRYHSFKQFDLKGKIPFVAGLVIVLVFVFIAIEPPLVLFLLSLAYAASGPVLTLMQIRKHRAARKPQEPPVNKGTGA